MKKFDLTEGHEIRGFVFKLYPTPEQDIALRQIENRLRSIWNWLVNQTEEVLDARQAFAVRERLVPSKPTRPSFDGLSSAESKAAAQAHREACAEWYKAVYKATKDHPACAFRPFKDLLAHYQAKHDYQLLSRVATWVGKEECPPLNAHTLQAVAKNWFQKSTRRKKFRRKQDAMPLQARSGQCFRLGTFGSRGKTEHFYNCEVKFNGLRIRGRLPGRAPWGRVLEGVSITRKADGWWASIKQEVPVRASMPAVPNTVIGIDVGLVLIAAMSDGRKVPNPRGAAYAERIAGRRALGKDTARLELRASRQVRHVIYNEIIKPLAETEMIKVEALPAHIGQMGSDKVSVMRMVHSMLVERYGTRVREVDCRYTSQDCSQCGHRSKDTWSYEHGRIGECPQCGYREDRDVNAARNIAARPPKSLAA